MIFNEEIRKETEKQILKEMEIANQMEPGSEERKRQIENVERLYKAYQADYKNEYERDNQDLTRELNEQKFEYEKKRNKEDAERQKKADENGKFDKYVTIGIKLLELGLPILTFIGCYKMGLTFEMNDNVMKSSFVRALVSKMKWTR